MVQIKKNYRGKFQGMICGDAGSYDVYRDENGTTLGWRWDSESSEPDYTGSETGLYMLAKAKLY